LGGGGGMTGRRAPMPRLMSCRCWSTDQKHQHQFLPYLLGFSGREGEDEVAW
jgi:hypothetical protein